MLDGRGNYEFKKITEDTTEFGSWWKFFDREWNCRVIVGLSKINVMFLSALNIILLLLTIIEIFTELRLDISNNVKISTENDTHM